MRFSTPALLVVLGGLLYNTIFLDSVDDKICTLPMVDDGTEDFRAPLGKFVNLSFGQTHFHLLGPADGEGVVLVHGFSSDHTWMELIAEDLVKKNLQVLYYDNYGSGWSNTPKGAKYDHRLFVGQLAELLLKLNFPAKFHLVGTSMGGAIAVAFSSVYPEKILSLSLLAPAGLPFELPLVSKLAHIPVLSSIISPIVAPTFMLKRIPDAYPDKVKFEKFINQSRKKLQYAIDKHPRFIHSVVSILNDFPMNALEEQYRAVGTHKYPVLFIWGKLDKTIPLIASEKAMEFVPRAKLSLYDNVGHALTFTIPKEIVKEIEEIIFDPKKQS